MVIEDAALLNRRVTHMTPAALFSRRLHVAGVSLVRGKETAAYAVRALPAAVLHQLDALALHQRCRGVSAVERIETMLTMPRKIWQPARPLNCIADYDIDRANKLRTALLPSLLSQHENISLEEFKAKGIRDYVQAFGSPSVITAAHWYSLFKRTVARDGGAEIWSRIEIFLSDSPKEKSPVQKMIAAALAEDFTALENYIHGIKNLSAPSDDDRAGVWALALTKFQELVRDGDSKKSAARLVRQYLIARASFLARSRQALWIAFKRKIQALEPGKSFQLADGRKKNGNRFTLPADDADKLRQSSAFKNGARIDAAWREEYRSLSVVTRERYPYSVKAPRLVHHALNRECVDAIKERHHGGKRALARMVGTLHGDRWAGIPSMHSFAVDDVTSNIQCFVTGEDGKDVLLQAQFIFVMDCSSRKIVGWDMSTDKAPTAALVCAAVVNAFKTHKISKELWVENGAVFGKSVLVNGKEDDMGRTVVAGLAQYGCSVHHYGKMNPTAKAELERSFEALQRLMERHPGYSGRVQMLNAPDDFKREERLIKNEKVEAKKFRYHFEELRIVIQELVDKYNSTPNNGLHLKGACPNDAFIEMRDDGNPPHEYDPHLDWWLSPEKTIVTVKVGGVRFEHKTSKRSLKVWGGRLANLDLFGKELWALVDRLDPSIVSFMNLDFTDPFTMEIAQTPSAREWSCAPGSGVLASELNKKREQVNAIEEEYKRLRDVYGNPRQQLLKRFRQDEPSPILGALSDGVRRVAIINPQMQESGELIQQQIAEIRDGRKLKEKQRRQATRLVERTGLHLSPEALSKLTPEQIQKLAGASKINLPEDAQ